MSIFISYRRDDSIATAGRIHDRLVQTFGREEVFVDVDDIPAGANFVRVLKHRVEQSRVLLAIIGPRWIDAKDGRGRPRLHSPDDFVAIEIASALNSSKVVVIPVLVDGAQMPRAAELPASLVRLTRRNAIELRNATFGSDVGRLERAISSALGSPRLRLPSRTAVLAGLAALCFAAGGLGVAELLRQPDPVAVSPAAAPPTDTTTGRPPAAPGRAASGTGSTTKADRPDALAYSWSIWPPRSLKIPSTVTADTPFGRLSCRATSAGARECTWP